MNKVLAHILKVEGGYVNNPADKGGPTNFGITISTLAQWRGVGVTEDDVKTLTMDEASNIYRVNYFNKLRLDEVDSVAIQLCLADQAVLCGVKRATERAQRVINSILGTVVVEDGLMGPKTTATLNKMNVDLFCKKYIRASQLYFAGICVDSPSQLVFLKGWLNRTYALDDLINP